MPQKGIFIEGTLSSLNQEFSITQETDIEHLKKALLKVYELNSDNLNIVVSIGKSALLKLGADVPNELKDFETISGVNDFQMPATQFDIFVWAHSFSKSEIFDFSLKSKNLLEPYLELEIIQEGFRYHDSRDIMGFVDGSANPKGDERKKEILIPAEQPHDNGCFVITQKWVHNLQSFHQNSVKNQERIIGRTIKDSIELEGDAMPHNSHVSRVDLKVDGEAIKIFRRSFPYANSDEHGLFFLGFSKNIERFEVLLKSMVGAGNDKVHDKMMEFTTPLSGSYYFAPSDAELVQILSS